VLLTRGSTCFYTYPSKDNEKKGGVRKKKELSRQNKKGKVRQPHIYNIQERRNPDISSEERGEGRLHRMSPRFYKKNGKKKGPAVAFFVIRKKGGKKGGPKRELFHLFSQPRQGKKENGGREGGKDPAHTCLSFLGKKREKKNGGAACCRSPSVISSKKRKSPKGEKHRRENDTTSAAHAPILAQVIKKKRKNREERIVTSRRRGKEKR